MLKCASLHTCEVDDPSIALAEIRQQLSERITPAKNTIGIIISSPEFIETGVVKHLSEELPFDLVGGTSVSQATNHIVSELVLTIFVMTSDEVRFVSGATEKIDESLKTDEKPALILSFPPFLLDAIGDDYLEAWGRVFPGVPVFGATAVSDSVDFSESRSFCNGVAHDRLMSYVLCYGNIKPRFLMTSLSEENTLPFNGEITKSTGTVVHEISKENANAYLKRLGMIKEGAPVETLWSVPFLVSQRGRADYDGVPVMRALASFDKDGSGFFCGKMEQGSTFTLLQCLPEDVVETALKLSEKIAALPDVNGVLGFPCGIRRIPLIHLDSTRELVGIKNNLGDIPFMLAYVGGEMCPTSEKDGYYTNRFHNYTFITMVV